MKKQLDAITAAQTAGAQTALVLMQNTLDAIERLAALNLNTMRDALESSADQNNKILKAKDFAQAGALQQAAAQPTMERTRAYYHQVYELMSQMQEQMTQVMQAHYSTLTQTATKASQEFAANTPVGGETFAAAMKTMIDASTQTFERLNETAHQLQASARDIAQSTGAATTAAAKPKAATRAKKA